MTIKSLKKKEPFWGASKIFKWDKLCPGIGIDLLLLDQFDAFKVQIGMTDERWFITSKKAKNLIQKYNSIYKVKTKQVAIIPWDEFDKTLDIATGKQQRLFI